MLTLRHILTASFVLKEGCGLGRLIKTSCRPRTRRCDWKAPRTPSVYTPPVDPPTYTPPYVPPTYTPPYVPPTYTPPYIPPGYPSLPDTPVVEAASSEAQNIETAKKDEDENED